MAMPAVNLTGQKFGFLTVIERAGASKYKCALWLCQCRCGAMVVRASQYLRTYRPHQRSCGCQHGNRTHGMTDTRPYQTWRAMVKRCLHPSDKDFSNYGGRGIKVCPTWAGSFATFWQDMQVGYADHLTLERIDNNGPYTQKNCRWATMAEQRNNRRVSVFVDTPWGRMTVTQAARAAGLKRVTLAARIQRGWPVALALSAPKHTIYSPADLAIVS